MDDDGRPSWGNGINRGGAARSFFSMAGTGTGREAPDFKIQARGTFQIASSNRKGRRGSCAGHGSRSRCKWLVSRIWEMRRAEWNARSCSTRLRSGSFTARPRSSSGAIQVGPLRGLGMAREEMSVGGAGWRSRQPERPGVGVRERSGQNTPLKTAYVRICSGFWEFFLFCRPQMDDHGRR
jgi:hypothetical protein